MSPMPVTQIKEAQQEKQPLKINSNAIGKRNKCLKDRCLGSIRDNTNPQS